MNRWLSCIGVSNLKNSEPRSDSVDNAKNTIILSTMSPLISDNKGKKSYITICKEEELKLLIKNISSQYGGDDEHFLEEYMSDVINKWSHNLDQAIKCFQDLVQQIASTRSSHES